MTDQGAAAEPFETFAATADEHGVQSRRVPPEEAATAIGEAVDPPAVGVALPWDDVSLPEDVTTEPTAGDLDAASTGVTAASLAVAEYGSVLLRADEAGSEPISLFPDRHVAVLREDDIVPDMATAVEWVGEQVRETRDSVIVATGPSATADMGALVQGAHGPTEVEVLVVT